MKTIKEKLVKFRLNNSGNILNHLSLLEESQWLNKEQLIILQKKRLTDIVKLAYEQVPYYKEILPLNHLIDKHGLIDLNSFSNIPILTKEIIRNQFERLKSKNLHQLKSYQNTSGGSTGEPLVFIQDKHVFEWEQSNKILFDRWSGRVIGDKQIRLWGSERDLLIGQESLKSSFGKWMRNEIWLNTFSMSDEMMVKYVKEINSFQPVQILAYVEPMYDLARFIEENKLKVYSPHSIMTSAGTLFPYMKEVIERVFKAPVFNRYGSREVGDIACECEQHEGLHISLLTHYVEILRKDGLPTNPGEMGEIFITSLTNYGMPLIRYRIEDMGIFGEEDCSCGRGLPVLKEVSGKVTDTFLTKEKKPINATYFEMLFYYQDWVKKFQVIQEDYEFIRLFIILKDQTIINPFHSYRLEIEKITSDFQVVMGKECKINFEFVKTIDATPSGKYRFLVSKVKRD